MSRDGIIPITADQDTAGPITRTVTDAAILLGVIAGHDPADPATEACLEPGHCFSNYQKFLDRRALRGARIAVPPFPASRADIMNNAIAVLQAQGAYVETIPALAPQLGICVAYPAPAGCSTVLMYGQKRDLNAPGGHAGGADGHHCRRRRVQRRQPGRHQVRPAIFEAASQLDISPGSADTRATRRIGRGSARSRGALDAVPRS